MTIYEEFAEHLASVSGDSVTTSKLPAKPTSSDGQWSVVADGGSLPTGGNILKWRMDVNIRVSYRHKSGSETYDADAKILAATASFQPTETPLVAPPGVVPITDTDEDSEGRHTASWQVQLTISTK